jgi:hypothetical protein
MYLVWRVGVGGVRECGVIGRQLVRAVREATAGVQKSADQHIDGSWQCCAFPSSGHVQIASE